MQMPPIRSMSKASTVAKIGRPMKKLTIWRLTSPFSRSAPPIGWSGSALVSGRWALLRLPARSSSVPGSAFLSVDSGSASSVARNRARKSRDLAARSADRRRGRRGGIPELLERDFDRLDDLARPDELDALDDHPLSGLEPRLEHSQPLVVVDRPDLDEPGPCCPRRRRRRAALPDLRGPLAPGRRRRRRTRRSSAGHDVLARQDRAIGVGHLGSHQERRGLCYRPGCR